MYERSELFDLFTNSRHHLRITFGEGDRFMLSDACFASDPTDGDSSQWLEIFSEFVELNKHDWRDESHTVFAVFSKDILKVEDLTDDLMLFEVEDD